MHNPVQARGGMMRSSRSRPSSTGSAGGGEESLKSPIARASANARERRKRELGELKQENEKLRLERDGFLQYIDELQAKVNEMRERDGELDVQLENDLLKAQLKEHETFVHALIHQARFGPPAAVLSPEQEKIKLYRQGADFAVQQVLSLLTRSVKQSSEWTRATIAKPTSTPFAVSFQVIPDFVRTNMKRLNLRTDQVLKARAQDVLGAYRRLWTETEMVKIFFSGSNFRPTSDATQITHNVTLLNESVVAGENESLGALHIQEKNENDVVDMLFAFSQKQVGVAHGTLVGTALPCSLLEPWKRKTVTLLARTSQKRNQEEEDNGVAGAGAPAVTASSTTTTSSSSNNSLWVEGCLAWDMEEDPGHCRMTTIVSVPENWVLFAKTIVFDEFIHQGAVSDKFLELTERFAGVMRGVTASSPALSLGAGSTGTQTTSSSQATVVGGGRSSGSGTRGGGAAPGLGDSTDEEGRGSKGKRRRPVVSV